MTKTFPVDIMTLIHHIQLQYEKVLANKKFKDRMCFCKQEIFAQFTYAVETMIIKLGARTLKFLEDYDMDLSTDLTDLKSWFNETVYEELYDNERVSNKLVLTFQLLQEYQDDKFFDLIKEKHDNILSALKDEKETGIEIEINNLFEEIRAWYELFLYMILAHQFNCQSFGEEFLTDHGITNDIKLDSQLRCIHDGDCKVHEGVAINGEQINIIMTNDFIDDMTWMDKLIVIISKYHTSPELINLTLDYRMYDHITQCKLSHRHYDKLLEAHKYFKNMCIKNHEGINFNGHYEKIKHLID